MMLVQENGIFIARCTKDERFAAKAAGFRWDPEKIRWWTKFPDCAVKLIDYADEPTRAQLAELKAQRDAALAASRATDFAGEIPSPAGLEYLPFQKAGIAYCMNRSGSLIGDEMGLGKTVEAIGIANADPGVRKVLIVCPASLKLNWAREWRKWDVKGLTVGTDVVIVNFDILKKLHNQLRTTEYDLLIVDEVHYCKNPKAQRTAEVLGRFDRDPQKVIKPIPAKRRVFLTGTPIVNRPIELWPIVKALDPEGLGRNWKHYVTRYCNGQQTGYGWDVSGATHLDELQERLRASFMVRRLKSEVLTELPPKRRQVILIEAEDDDAAESVAQEQTAWKAMEAALAKARADVELAKAEGEQTYEQAVSRLRDAAQVAFTEISKMRHAVALAKIPTVIEHIKNTELPKLVVMAYHHDVVDAIAKEFGRAAVTVDGRTPIEARQAAVDRFQSDPACTLFIGTIKAAGVGITLTAASTVIFAELDWVPGNVSQAEDRCHRIGQTGSVLVQHLVLDGSLDARMAQVIVDKQNVIDAALDKEGRLPEGKINVDDYRVPALPTGEPATASTSRQQIELAAQGMTPERIGAVHSCLRILAGLDADRASALNDMGFNKPDSHIGNSLAESQRLTAKQAALGLRIVKKYHRQLPAQLLETAKGELEVAA